MYSYLSHHSLTFLPLHVRPHHRHPADDDDDQHHPKSDQVNSTARIDGIVSPSIVVATVVVAVVGGGVERDDGQAPVSVMAQGKNDD